MSSVLLAMVAVAAARTVAGARAADQQATDRAQAQLLAQGMLSEVLIRPYADPEGGTILGLDLGETLGLRTGYDDIDDYHGYVENPIRDSAGNPVAGLSAWSREVAVEWVRSSDYSSTRLTETDVKRVTVTVKKNGRRVLQASAIRSRARDGAES